jgi:hypothetical protein
MRLADIIYIKPTGLTICPQFERDQRNSKDKKRTSHIPKNNFTTTTTQQASQHKLNIISNDSVKKIRNALNNLYAISDVKYVYSKQSKKSFSFKLNFITLTLSSKQKHSDNEIKRKLLEPFLKWMQYNHNMNSYVWKAETQKNGNIHFHITTNIFIHYKAIRNAWNRVQSKLNYIPNNYTMLDDDVPNSTDVHSVRNAKQCIGYMVKYMTKSEPDKRQIDGQMWNCSKNLKQKPPFIEYYISADNYQFIEWESKYCRYKLTTDFATLLYSYHEGMLQLPEPFNKTYKAYLKFIAAKETTQKYFTLN